MSAIALLIGICLTMLLPQIPAQNWIYALALGSLFLISLQTKPVLRLICITSLGFCLMAWHINQLQTHFLPNELEAQKITVVGTISSVVEDSKKPKQKFNFKVIRLDEKSWKLPANIQLSWTNPKANLRPGDIWTLKVKLKRPRNYANPGSFDSEKYYFQRRVVALGYVVDAAENRLLQSDPWASPINRLRQHILTRLHASLADSDFSHVIAALTLGIKGAMPEEQMEVLQNTGTAHLLAISGLHLGIIASLCFVCLRVGWRYVPMAWLVIPAPWIAACGALGVSVVYALLAGLSIATQRSLLMVTVFLSGILFRRKISSTQSYCLALWLVLLWDPFAVLSIGFWFSFLAVAFLIFALRGRPHWLRPQLVIALALLPLNLLFFGKNSLIGPIANSIAIPWIGVTVLPLCLLAVLLLPVLPGVSNLLFKIAANNVAGLWPLLQKLALLPIFVWQLPSQHLTLIIIAGLLGAAWIFMPRGLPGRWWGIFGLAPLLFVQSNAIPYGQAEFTLLDVGQGLSTVVRTQKHVLVYDTGAKLNDNFDLGTRVVAPYLQTIGVKKIDALMISHGDNDHVGGAPGLLRQISARAIITSADQTLVAYNPATCQAGQQWEWDGVVFTVLHPSLEIVNKKRNDHSCVLMIQAGEHKALLTGDIEKRSEKQLIARYGADLHADLMLVPHHGSKTSSSLEFLQTVNPKYALIPVGYKNQYGHPKEPVLQRYRDLDIAVLRTEYDGAISFRLGGDMLPHCYRREQKGFWFSSFN